MADNDEVSGSPDHDAAPTEETRPVLPPDLAPEAMAAAAAPQPVLKTRWRDRAWSFRAMLAVALATLVLGGVAGGTIVAVAGDDNDDHGHFWMGPGGPGERMPGWNGPRQFKDGGPKWQWNDGPQPPDGGTTPYGQPSPPTPSPSE